MIPLYWHRSNNFGDALAPWIVERITGQKPQYVEPHEGQPFLVTGSIFGYGVRSGIVWGAGCAVAEHLDPRKLAPPGKLEVIAPRGSLSVQLVREAGHSPQTWGDAGFIVPRLYTPTPFAKVNVAIMCSWVDKEYVNQNFPQVPLIDSMGKIERVIDQICSTRFLVSSSLHGLVIATAFGIPCRWVSFSDRMVGDGFKYKDAGFSDHVRLTVQDDLDKIQPKSAQPIDVNKLWACCPLPQRT